MMMRSLRSLIGRVCPFTGVPYVMRLQAGLRGPKTRFGAPTSPASSRRRPRASPTCVGATRSSDRCGGVTHPPGTFAEYTAVPAATLTRKPDGVSFEEAAASVMSGLTALIAMRDVGAVGSGTRVLVNGASGGVGTLACQIAKARRALASLLTSGALKVVIDTTYPLAEAPRAVAHMLGHHAKGKIAITV
jgi:NADPH:quinone reductase-like Zn-dependent oxidoreductase